jgi:hypothetical protein
VPAKLIWYRLVGGLVTIHVDPPLLQETLATDLETTKRLLDEWGDPRLELENPACDDSRGKRKELAPV